MHSIKTKLGLGISIFVIFIFTITAVLLIKEKRAELAMDIYTSARNFSELTSSKIADLYESFLKESGFVIFNREMKDIFRKNEDISAIRLYTYAGEVLYDSVEEQDRQFEGEMRKTEDIRIKSSMPGFLLEDWRIVYLKKDDEGNYIPVDADEKEIEPITDKDKIKNIIYPVNGKFAAQFDVTYKNLESRVWRMTERIIFLLIFGVLLGLGFAVYFARRITNPIDKLKTGALIIAKGDFTARVPVQTKDEVGILAETFNRMAADLEVSTKALVYRERVAKELEVAANIQKQILPKTLPKISGLDIAACLIPADEIGGDCYDFIEIDPQTHLIYVSDVTGHGVPSGIVVSIANALIYSYAKSPGLREILINANRVLKAKTASNMFMTLLMLRYRGGNLDYISAGHPEMLHYHAADKKVTIEKGGGIALGMVPDISNIVAESSMQFAGGDVVALYSDGIPEALNERGEQYGLQRMKRALNDAAEFKNAEIIKNVLLADVKEFCGKAKQADDITLVVIKRA